MDRGSDGDRDSWQRQKPEGIWEHKSCGEIYGDLLGTTEGRGGRVREIDIQTAQQRCARHIEIETDTEDAITTHTNRETKMCKTYRDRDRYRGRDYYLLAVACKRKQSFVATRNVECPLPIPACHIPFYLFTDRPRHELCHL